MALAASIPPLPTLPAEVLALAAQQGVTPYLGAVLEMTRRIFPGSHPAVFVEEDAEVAGDQYIVLEVDVTGFSGGQLAESRQRWLGEVSQHCPANRVNVFYLGMKVA